MGQYYETERIKLTMKEMRPIINRIIRFNRIGNLNYDFGYYNDRNPDYNRIKLQSPARCLTEMQMQKLQEALEKAFPDYWFNVYEWSWFTFMHRRNSKPIKTTCIRYGLKSNW